VPRKQGRLITKDMADVLEEQQPLLNKVRAFVPDSPVSKKSTAEIVTVVEGMDTTKSSRHAQWISLAVASGACAAFNGVFAKLTTTKLTTSFATSIADLFGLGDGEKIIEYIIRAMWTLFTKALARGTSTTQVSIINTSSNFMITAILGFIIFGESLPPLWWVGAALLVAGNVIIGRREEHVDDNKDANERNAADGGGSSSHEEEEVLLADDVELEEEVQRT
ncbi:hypothetical protein DH86_00002468, partial [Scytalidium sp. 3C]